MIKNALQTLLLLSIASASYADHESIFSDHHVIPIVLSAAKSPQQQTEAPASTTVIRRSLYNGKGKYQVASHTLDLTTESTSWNIKLEHIQALRDSQRLIWGLGATHESVYAPFRTNSQRTHTNTRVQFFGNVKSYLTNTLTLNIGGLVEHDKLSGVNTSPRLSVSYLASLQNSYRLTATQAYRTPVISEEKYEISLPKIGIIQTSAGHLEPEKVRSIEAGYHGIHLQNKLSTDLHNGLKVLDNQGNARTYAAEQEINLHPNRHNLAHLGGAYTRVNRASNEPQKASIPKHNFNLLFSHRYTDGWYNGLEDYYISQMQSLGDQHDLQGTYQRVDLSAGKLTKLADNQAIDITLDAQLAFDKDLHQQAIADNLSRNSISC